MKENSHISITSAKTNNLKDIDVNIKLNAITCISGPSGSGKTSLAFHTLEAESRRRFLNSYPSGMKFFQEIPQRPDVAKIEPILPVWSLPQSNPVLGSRMNVVDLLDLEPQIEKLFFLHGSPICPTHNTSLVEGSWTNEISKLRNSKGILHFFINKNEYLKNIKSSILPSRTYCEESKKINKFKESDSLWELFRVKSEKLSSIDNKIKKLEFNLNNLSLFVVSSEDEEKIINFRKDSSLGCQKCDFKLIHNFLSPAHLSPFTGVGSCLDCNGYGSKLVYSKNKLVKDDSLSIKNGAISVMNFSRFNHLIPEMLIFFKKNSIDLDIPFKSLPEKKWKLLFKGDEKFIGLDSLLDYLESKKYKKNIRIYIRGLKEEIICTACDGTRLNQDAYNFALNKLKFGEVQKLKLIEIHDKLLNDILLKLPSKSLGSQLVKVMLNKLEVSIKLGLGNLILKDKVKSLSAGEYQRILLVKYFSYLGSGSLFILDEPTLGLNPDEQKIAFNYLKKLKNQGNTIVVIDHSETFQKLSDEVILMGPGAGEKGGSITYQGKYKSKPMTKLLRKIAYEGNDIKLKNISLKNKKYNLLIPENGITWITGDSSTEKNNIFKNCIAAHLYLKLNNVKINDNPIPLKSIAIPKNIATVALFTSTSLKSNRRSNIGSYIGLGPFLRKKYANTQMSKDLLLKDGHFSSNSKLGACQTCEGRGELIVDMKFLEDVVYKCPDCLGNKLRPLYGNIKLLNRTFNEAVKLPIEDLFKNIEKTSKINRIIELLKILNLDYLSLDRTLSSLSGGEKQRIKLLLFLITPPKNSILMFENLSFGLSFIEINKICAYFQNLVESKNSIIILDSNPIFSNICNHKLLFKNDFSVETDTYLV